MRVYIDAGCFDGDTIERFTNSTLYDENTVIHAFEPNPFMKEKKIMKYAPGNTTFHREAVWTTDGEMDFFVNHKKKSEGSSLMREKISGNLDKKHPHKVKTIDFSKWMLDTFSPEDFIVLKMDIEGAEYQVVPKMIRDGSINLVRIFFLETHMNRIPSIKSMDHLNMIDAILQLGIELHGDYSHFDGYQKK